MICQVCTSRLASSCPSSRRLLSQRVDTGALHLAREGLPLRRLHVLAVRISSTLIQRVDLGSDEYFHRETTTGLWAIPRPPWTSWAILMMVFEVCPWSRHSRLLPWNALCLCYALLA